MSKRQQIVEQILTRMQGITVDNGYQTDLGVNVGDWETNWSEDQLPALSVCDLIDAHTLDNNQQDAQLQWNKLPVQLKIFTRSDQTPADLRTLIEDVWKAVRADRRWNNLALYTIPLRSGMVIDEKAFALGGAAVEIEITYLTNSLDTI